MRNKKYFGGLVFILAVIITVVLMNFGGFLFAGGLTSSKSKSSKPAVSPKTYENSKYGFEVKYPPHWLAVESDSGVIINPPEAGGNVYFGVSADDRPLETIRSLVAVSKIIPTDVKVAGELGFEYSDPVPHRAIFIAHKNQTFIFRVYNSVSTFGQADQILSTFKFTE